jgi:lipopolysaccharide transport system permease protein
MYTYLRDLIRELVIRELKLRYKRSLLGITWSLLNPLLQMLIFTLLYRNVLKLDIPNYPLFVFSGVLAWTWFQTALTVSTGAITDNRELIRQPGFPVAILPMVSVTTHLIHFLLALPILLIFIILGGGELSAAIIALPLVIGLQFALSLGLGYLVATVHVTFRDTQHLIGVALTLLFYLTPIFYDASDIPQRYRTLYNLNPMVHVITAYRTILIQGDLPNLRLLLILGALVAVLLWLGHRFFTHASYRFAEEL